MSVLSIIGGRGSTDAGRPWIALLGVILAPWLVDTIAAQPPTTVQRALRETLRIDGADHDWATVRSVRVMNDGRILLLTQDQPREWPAEIRVFSSAGSQVATFGRRGQGPGEFQHLKTIGVIGDTIWGGDWVRRHVTWFGANGNVLRTIAADSAAAGGPLRPGSATPHILGWDSPLAAFTDGSLLMRPAIGPIRGSPPVPILRTTMSGVATDTVFMLSMNVGLVGIPRSGGGVALSSNPFAVQQRYDVSVDGRRIAILDQDYSGAAPFTMRLRVLNEQGSTLLDQRIPFQVVPHSPAAVDSTVAATAARVAGSSESAIRSALAVPPSTAPVSKVLVDVDGSVWLRGRESSGGATWTVHGANGTALFTVREPPNTRLLVLDKGVWGIQRDSDGVESVVRYEIAPGINHP